MKTFKDAGGELHALEPDGSQDYLIKGDWVEITEAEADVERAGKLPKATYVELRAAAYMPFQELLDGMTKQASTDPAVKAAGDAQVAAYYAHNLAVKAQYPKV